ncbi:MAG: hypothetical protein ACOYKA_02545 [Legionellaceae bacterium]
MRFFNAHQVNKAKDIAFAVCYGVNAIGVTSGVAYSIYKDGKETDAMIKKHPGCVHKQTTRMGPFGTAVTTKDWMEDPKTGEVVATKYCAFK